MAPAPLSDSDVAELLAGRPLCLACTVRDQAAPASWPKPVVNALVVDPDDVVHAGDAIAGTTVCGKDGNLWRWVIPAAGPGTADEVEQ